MYYVFMNRTTRTHTHADLWMNEFTCTCELCTSAACNLKILLQFLFHDPLMFTFNNLSSYFINCYGDFHFSGWSSASLNHPMILSPRQRRTGNIMSDLRFQQTSRQVIWAATTCRHHGGRQDASILRCQVCFRKKIKGSKCSSHFIWTCGHKRHLTGTDRILLSWRHHTGWLVNNLSLSPSLSPGYETVQGLGPRPSRESAAYINTRSYLDSSQSGNI